MRVELVIHYCPYFAFMTLVILLRISGKWPVNLHPAPNCPKFERLNKRILHKTLVKISKQIADKLPMPSFTEKYKQQ